MKEAPEAWKESPLGCYPSGTAYENEKFRVVSYEYYSRNGYMEKVPLYWLAYNKYPIKNGKYVTDKCFKTAKEAMAACREEK